MADANEILGRVYRDALRLPLSNDSKYILFSDIHRGDNSWADDFARNQNLFFHALQHYYREDFAYIEVGDGDELWENRHFSDIQRAHSHIFWQMQQFYEKDRLHLIWGNHDMERKDPRVVEKSLYTYTNDRTSEESPLFPNIQVHEGIVLQHDEGRILLTHGHQADPMNYAWWKLGRFMVRAVWRQLQLLAVHDPTSPAKSRKKRHVVEDRLSAWAQANGVVLICGHTHRPSMPRPSQVPYFNTGSCVHPRAITGIEIVHGTIALIKWSITPNDLGLLRVSRDVIDGPLPLSDYFG